MQAVEHNEGRIFELLWSYMMMTQVSMMGDNADIMPDLGIHWQWHTYCLTKAVDKRPHHLKCTVKVLTGEPVCLTQYWGVCKSRGDLYRLIKESGPCTFVWITTKSAIQRVQNRRLYCILVDRNSPRHSTCSMYVICFQPSCDMFLPHIHNLFVGLIMQQ